MFFFILKIKFQNFKFFFKNLLFYTIFLCSTINFHIFLFLNYYNFTFYFKKIGKMPSMSFKKVKNKINYTISVPHMHNQRATQHAMSAFCSVRWPQGLKLKNLIIGLESKLFFLQGVNRDSPKLQGVKTY